MSASTCETCGQRPATLNCESCNKAICKKCRKLLETAAFDFWQKVPKEISHSLYCENCWELNVVPAQIRYDELMAKAEQTFYVSKNYPGYVRIFRKHTKKVEVTDCRDRKEAQLRMAFQAAELGFNSIIEAEIDSKKARSNERSSTLWWASSLPADIDGERYEKNSLKGF